jgi:hypothetical protein
MGGWTVDSVTLQGWSRDGPNPNSEWILITQEPDQKTPGSYEPVIMYYRSLASVELSWCTFANTNYSSRLQNAASYMYVDMAYGSSVNL